MRAPNDMGYAAALLKQKGYSVSFCDYQTERRSEADLVKDFCEFRPATAFLSITNSTVHSDLAIVRRLKSLFPHLVVILKGALFFDAPPDVLASLDLSD